MRLLAMGFTLVYSTVWFFDLYYGAAAAIGAYGVFYLRSKEAIGGLYQVQNPAVNALFAVIVAGVLAWALYEIFFHRTRGKGQPARHSTCAHRRHCRGCGESMRDWSSPTRTISTCCSARWPGLRNRRRHSGWR